MKRGFLLSAEEKKTRDSRKPSILPTTTVVEADLQDLKDLKAKYVSSKLPHGDLTEEENALPSDYDRDNVKIVYEEIDPWNAKFVRQGMSVTTIPQCLPDDETQCEWILGDESTKDKVTNAPGYPARIPKPRIPDLHEVRSTPDMGQGLFARHDIKCGELVFAERPLLVSPQSLLVIPTGILPHYSFLEFRQIQAFLFERMLEYVFARMPSDSQADYRALHNAHTRDGTGPLFGIKRTNGYSISNLFDGPEDRRGTKYSALCKIASRLNHSQYPPSCMPNVRYHFELDSFSIQFHALRDIKAGEQLLYAYSCCNSTVAGRQIEHASYGFVCKCPACVNATPKTDRLRQQYQGQIDFLTTALEKSLKVDEFLLRTAVDLEKEVDKEGLRGDVRFVKLLRAISLAYTKLGKPKKSAKYGVLADTLQNCFRKDQFPISHR